MRTTRVLLVDDQPLFRGAVAALLARQPGIEVVGEAENGLQAVERANELKPDLVIMDVEMPVLDGVEAVRRCLIDKLGSDNMLELGRLCSLVSDG